MKIFVVKEVPISSRELRQELLDIVTPWHKAQKKYGHLLKVNSSFWNVPEGCVSFVLEYMSGNSLAKLFDSVGCIPEFILSKVMKEVSKGVGFVHYMIGPHGGISPSQVFFTREGYIKIGLGLAKRVANTKVSLENDVFDIGHTTLIAALGGSDWFEQDQIDNVSTNCCLYHALEEIEPNPLFNRFSPNLKNFLCGCLQFDESRRLTLQEVIGHPWIVEKSMIGPKVRITELMQISYKWHGNPEVNYQAQKQLDRIFESLYMILGSENLPAYGPDLVRELALDLGIEEELIQNRLNIN